jgi:formamidopyrimidine-DNA glycosylase
MPEHYEVCRMADYLKEYGLIGQRLQTSLFLNQGERILAGATPQKLKSLITNQSLLAIKVKAKYTGFEFNTGTIVFHYRFTGIPHLENCPYDQRLYSIFSLPITKTNPRHCRFRWQFESHTLHYFDTRCLSKLYCYPGKPFEQTPQYLDLASDISSLKFLSFDEIALRYKTRKIVVKQWLLDQTVAPSGLGNYLACEVLARAGCDPFLKVGCLTSAQYDRILQAFVEVHQLAISHADYAWFNVFNRKKCRVCKTDVSKIKRPQNAQTTHFCSRCQDINR